MTRRFYYSTDPGNNLTISLGRKVRKYDRETPYITGYIKKDTFRVLYLFVPEAQRRKGLGRLLVNKSHEVTGVRRVLPDFDLTPEGLGFVVGLVKKND